MPYYTCAACGQLFHEPTATSFAWCSCGQPLSDADRVSGDPTAEAPLSAAPPEPDTRVEAPAVPVSGIVATVEHRLGPVGEDEAIFAVALSDGTDVATIAIQVPRAAADTEAELQEFLDAGLRAVV